MTLKKKVISAGFIIKGLACISALLNFMYFPIEDYKLWIYTFGIAPMMGFGAWLTLKGASMRDEPKDLKIDNLSDQLLKLK